MISSTCVQLKEYLEKYKKEFANKVPFDFINAFSCYSVAKPYVAFATRKLTLENERDASLYFWTFFLINPMVSVTILKDTSLLGKIDLSGAYKIFYSNVTGKVDVLRKCIISSDSLRYKIKLLQSIFLITDYGIYLDAGIFRIVTDIENEIIRLKRESQLKERFNRIRLKCVQSEFSNCLTFTEDVFLFWFLNHYLLKLFKNRNNAFANRAVNGFIQKIKAENDGKNHSLRWSNKQFIDQYLLTFSFLETNELGWLHDEYPNLETILFGDDKNISYLSSRHKHFALAKNIGVVSEAERTLIDKVITADGCYMDFSRRSDDEGFSESITTFSKKYEKAYRANKELMLKLFLYLFSPVGVASKDFRLGVLDFFYERNDKMFQDLIVFASDNIRWKEAFNILKIHWMKRRKTLPNDAFLLHFIQERLGEDNRRADRGESISTLAKWMPSENASDSETRRLARALMRHLNISNEKAYRKELSRLRSLLNLKEVSYSGGLVYVKTKGEDAWSFAQRMIASFESKKIDNIYNYLSSDMSMFIGYEDGDNNP